MKKGWQGNARKLERKCFVCTNVMCIRDACSEHIYVKIEILDCIINEEVFEILSLFEC